MNEIEARETVSASESGASLKPTSADERNR